MKIEIDPRESATVVHLQGQLDSNTSPTLEKQLTTVLDERPAAIILDLAATDYVSSAGLRVLLATAKRCRTDQRRFVLCAVNDDVMEVLTLTGFYRVLDLYPDLAQALAAASPSSP